MKSVDILNSKATQLKQTKQQDESKMTSVKTKLLTITKTTKKLMATQNRLMSDIKSLLKSLAKVCWLNAISSCCLYISFIVSRMIKLRLNLKMRQLFEDFLMIIMRLGEG